MKKIILSALLMFTLTCFSQNNSNMIYKFDSAYASQSKEFYKANTTFIINVNGTKKIEMYQNGRLTTYYQTGKVTKGYTKNGAEYQAVDILEEDGLELRLQLFKDSIRIIYTGLDEYFEYF
ncbi:hypothetical protein [Flavobacterium sp.]|jgi:hypothetical protein|uniref:hypothetical protein n=1 Tax=Flavobacterium sp. TaxID=239 RepID=UPI0037C1181D